jgi:hypothetical protein
MSKWDADSVRSLIDKHVYLGTRSIKSPTVSVAGEYLIQALEDTPPTTLIAFYDNLSGMPTVDEGKDNTLIATFMNLIRAELEARATPTNT